MIETKNLSLGYDKNIVIKNLHLKIEEGDFICVVGPNGSGKTTLIKGLLGLLTPKSGEIIYQGLNKTEIGFMSQESKNDPNFPASVFEIVLSGVLGRKKFHPFYTVEEKSLALEKLKLLHIEKLKNEKFSELSGGQRQKVLLARGLVAASKLLILDEPSNNLDPSSKDSLYNIISKLNKQGLTIIMITHDLDHGNLLGNKVLSLRDKDIFFGPTKEFIRKVHNE
ncbi:metal ABC transporter ATP-binding protein [Candidatus Saccharibacteria bacterium]|nr:metal ABC transporter ATP-binding protein [Candidatus Saccharibacteria bacterium]